MANQKEQILVPDIGGAKNVDVIEVLVKPGDKVAIENPLVTLEGDKATMDIPSPFAGTIDSVAVKVGDKVSENSLLVIISLADQKIKESEENKPALAEKKELKKPDNAEQTAAKVAEEQWIEVRVPDIGGANNVDVIEVLVKAGDAIKEETPLITLEGDKATMDVPSPIHAKVEDVKVKVGDKVSAGDLILIAKKEAKKIEHSLHIKQVEDKKPTVKKEMHASRTQFTHIEIAHDAMVHAGPAVRRLAHEIGIDLNQVKGTGEKNRILKEDVKRYLQAKMQGGAVRASGAGLNILPQPVIDFSQFGEIETAGLSKIKKISGANLHRNWVSIPHITQFEEADISEMEAFRQANKEVAKQEGYSLTPLVFVMKAVVAALRAFPHFNASLDQSGEHIILKKYFHIGVAVDTPNGLVVPVIRDVDKKGLSDLARELAAISKKAREKGLSMAEMQGGSFSISSLGGIGGTAFTPIVNAPEVAILGVSRSQMKPVYQKESNKFEPRLMLPLSLSYDHRVIDGADGARFITYLAKCLADIRNLLL